MLTSDDIAARLGMVAVLTMAPALPMLVEALAPMIDEWRTTPPVTEL